MAREPKFVANCDKPFGRVPLIPFRSVPVVHRKLVMEIMVSLPECHKRCNEMIFWRVLVIECAFAQPMSQRVYREGGL